MHIKKAFRFNTKDQFISVLHNTRTIFVPLDGLIFAGVFFQCDRAIEYDSIALCVWID